MADCPQRALVDAHFACKGDIGREARLREHLWGCESCQRYYAHCQQLTELDPGAASAKQRIGAALGLDPPRAGVRGGPWLFASGGRGPWLPALVAVAVAAVLLLVVINLSRWSRPERGPEPFAARGGAGSSASAPQLHVYLVRDKARPIAAPTKLPERPELAFAYANPSGYRHLLVFGLDERRRVYWFYPAWRDAAKNPAAPSIAKGAKLRELSDAVTHRYGGRSLTLVAVFSNTKFRVQEVERRLAARRSQDELWGRDQDAVLVRRHSLGEKR